MESRDPVSPELVLVAPELADEARAALPDRPWEQFAPPATLRRPRPDAAAGAATPPPSEAPAHDSIVVRVAALLPLALLTVFVIVIVLGSLPLFGQRPTLGPPPAPPPPAATTQTTPG